VPSRVRGGEDEVMLAVVPMPGASLTPSIIFDHANNVLPRFARPRFVELVSELPKTATGKGTTAQARRRTGDLGCRGIRVVFVGLSRAAWRSVPQAPLSTAGPVRAR
jgi:hypothetical protein